MSSPDPMAEIRASFFIECDELLEALNDGLQMLSDDGFDDETINIVFRAVHSIKGGAGAFSLDALVRFTHRYESVLDEIRARRLELNTQIIKLFFRCFDHLSDLVRASSEETDLPQTVSETLLAELDQHLGESTDTTQEEEGFEFTPLGITLDLPVTDDEVPDETDQSTYIKFTPDTSLYSTGNEPFKILGALRELGIKSVVCDFSQIPPLEQLIPDQSYLFWSIEMDTGVDPIDIGLVFEFVEGLCRVEISDGLSHDADELALPLLADLTALADLTDPSQKQMAELSQSSSDAPVSQPQPPRSARSVSSAKPVIRVDLDKIEQLGNLIGELVINQAMLSQSLETFGLSPHSDIMNRLDEFYHLTRNIQDSVMTIRAQPVKSLFQRMSRIVREASTAVGKNTALHTSGEMTEVDKTVVERLADPLTHMVRNAIDHGLESPEDRLAAGKPAEGAIRLSAAHRSGRVIIEVSDDGAGINRPKVRQIAIDKGLIPASATVSDFEIDSLLFMPGFSTSAEVSALSGRGVGMDVVRNAIQALGGSVSIASTPGKGTTFTISMPLTLAVLDGMLINIADETLVIPLNFVVETLKIDANTIYEAAPGTNMISVRGQFVPILDLGAQMGYRAPLESYADKVILLATLKKGQLVALIVDQINDQRQVVIKGLDENLCRIPGVAAATILGNGKVALIIDPSDIVDKMENSTAGALLVEKEYGT